MLLTNRNNPVGLVEVYKNFIMLRVRMVRLKVWASVAIFVGANISAASLQPMHAQMPSLTPVAFAAGMAMASFLPDVAGFAASLLPTQAQKSIHKRSLEASNDSAQQVAKYIKINAQERRSADVVVPQVLPDVVMAYLKTKEVSADLKKQLDGFFGAKELQAQLEGLYTYSDRPRLLAIRKTLEAEGFTFCKLGSHHIFKHRLFPGYIFKMPRGHVAGLDLLNVGRIRYGEIIQQASDAHRLTINNVPVKVPGQWAYAMPIAPGFILPHFIVVEQKIMGQPLVLPARRRGHSEPADITRLKEITGYPDTLPGNNILMTPDAAFLIDTEAHGVELSYPSLE